MRLDPLRPLGTATLVAAVASSLFAADPPAAPPADDPYRAPTAPLDPRITAPERMTESDPPPLPEAMLLPIPPHARIAVDPRDVPVDRATWDRGQEALRRGAAALLALQDPAGGWLIAAEAAPTPSPGAAPAAPSDVSVAVTALCLRALVQTGAPLDEDVPRRAVAWLDTARADDGAYGRGALTNYVTATVVSALAGLDELALRERIATSVRWLQASQWDQGEGVGPRQDWFGGAGYGNRGRPDLSNTQLMLEAMYDAGLSPSEPAFQKALAFVTRTQNLKATNPAPWAGNDGGFVYTPANGGESFGSEAAGEGRSGELMPAEARSLRSYGSMTYAGFKTLLYAGLSPDDLRVRAAFDWIRRNFTFEENPGLGAQGLYYYYHAMSRALRVAQQHTVTDHDGVAHNWRAELIDAIARRQRPDGTWRNEADRWLESTPELATAFAMLALEEALKEVAGTRDAAGE